MFLINELQKILELVVFQFKQIFPYWMAGVFAGSLLSVYALPKISRTIEKFNKQRYNILSGMVAAILGVASPICMYGTIPLIAALGKKGIPQYILATFMVSSILLNPNLLMLSFSLGTSIALFRLFSCIAVGIIAGILVKVFFSNKELFNFSSFESNVLGEKKKKKFIHDLHKAITITAPYFLVGILLSALFDRYIPKQFIISLFGQNRGLGVLFAASLGIPVYVCGGGTIPLIMVWLKEGMTPGAAIAFMISGPATKLTNLGAVKIILGVRNFTLYIVFNLIFAMVMGVLANAIIKGY